MSLPEVVQTVQDFGLGQILPSSARIQAKVGVCSGATPNVVQAWAGPSLRAMIDALGSGPLAEAAAYHRSASSSELYTCAATASQAGVAGTVTHVGTGASVMSTTGTPLDAYDLIVTITRAATGLAARTAAFTYSLDGGATQSPEISVPTSGSYAIAGTGLTIVFTDATFVVDDTYSLTCLAPNATTSDIIAAITALAGDPRTWGWLHVVGSPRPSNSAVTATGTTPPAVTLTGTPAGFDDGIVDIVVGGGIGVGTFRVSTDDGATYGSTLTLASTYAIPDTGLTLHFPTSTYGADNQFTWNTYGGIGALFAALDAKMTALAAVYRYAGAIMEMPDASDAILLKAAASLSSTEQRVMVAGGYCSLASSAPVNGGATYKRPAAWPLAARRSKAQIHEDLGWVAAGSLPGISALYRDENLTPGFGAARIATLRTIVGMPGFYAASDRVGDMMSAPGSDFNLSQRRTIMDVALTTNRAALLPYLNSSLVTNKKTGCIKETEARAIEGRINSALEGALVNSSDGAHVTAVKSTVDRAEVIATTNNLTADVKIVPFGYAKGITVTVHYSPTV